MLGGARIFFDQPAAEELHVVPVLLPEAADAE